MRTQDFDGDGKIDIFIDDQAFWSDERAWRNDGNGNFSPYSGILNPVS